MLAAPEALAPEYDRKIFFYVRTRSALTAVDRGMPAGYYASAQNCHRFDGRRSTSDLRGGWNKVTPWAYDNDETPSEHRGTRDPTYVPRSGN